MIIKSCGLCLQVVNELLFMFIGGGEIVFRGGGEDSIGEIGVEREVVGYDLLGDDFYR